MKPLNQYELRLVCDQLLRFKGTPIQKVVGGSEVFALALWTGEGVKWIWISLKTVCPLLLLIDEPLPQISKKTSPLSLFLNAHLKGKTLSGAEVVARYGRVVKLAFESAEGSADIEIRLFKQGVNLIVKSGDKQISFLKPRQLVEAKNIEEPEVRTLNQIFNEFYSEFHEKAKTPVDQEAQKQKAIVKKNQTIDKIKADIESKIKSPWRLVGEWLKAQASLDVPSEWRDFIDPKKGLSWNIENCFKHAKTNEEKIENARERLAALESEIEKLKNGFSDMPIKKEKHALSHLNVKGRTFELPNATAFMGKSARDNLQLLRKAHAWDYWLHLRDYPSAHVIIARAKGAKITDDDFRSVSSWLIRESIKKNYEGVAYEIIICECRFVKPIKGDRLGRVTFHNEKVIRVKV